METAEISRRSFLRLGLCAGAGAALAVAAPGLGLWPHPDARAGEKSGLRRRGGLLLLPDRGKVFVANDFHARFRDYQKWLERTDVEARWKKGEDVYALIVGDVVDRKSSDTESDADGDKRILESIRRIRKTLGKKAGRFIVLRGNHENRVLAIYTKMKEKMKPGPGGRAEAVRKLYESPSGAYYRQFNFIERIDEEDVRMLGSMPVAAVGPQGLAFLHGGPSKSLAKLKDIVDLRAEVVKELLWARPKPVDAEGYDAADLRRLLTVLGGSTLLVSGHTPLSYLPPGWIRSGIGIMENLQVILAASYGSKGGRKSYLHLDLAKAYAGTSGLTAGKEIHPLIPK
jgi:hypothetical protein